ncbi:hybrid sensor histidine kinase/response regulator [Azohydromonas caseinilytica]|uniref:Response regulator n=1 Tax=Azohydromonas caseinilytica TaxID=2728836 RepID=A0A848FA31_9BURK|nr:histidine kinase [Azohydromonas caseinilytica]NML14851.1 response regulator [Azohydromonas caseinilytica]
MTSRCLRVLHIEDAELDHELALAHLRHGGLAVQTLRVETEPAYRQALQQPWDVVLSDFMLPGGFTGLRALEILKEDGARVLPFILVSGAIGEDVAVEAMRNGASDYLLKHNLARLAPAVDNAIQAAEMRRAKLRADELLARSQRQLRELAQHLQTSVEAERVAIAREIHDDVGGSLTALRFELAWLERHNANPEAQAHLASARESLTHAIEASKRIMQNLRPAILEQGLVAALQWMVQGFARRTGIECSLRTSHDSLQLPAGVPLVAYRTAQEALTNIHKHARAGHVWIDLALGAGVLSLEISDDGRGLSREDLAKAQSFGIRGLHERAGTVGGWIDLGPRPGGGTTLILSIPLAAQSGDDAADEAAPWGVP